MKGDYPFAEALQIAVPLAIGHWHLKPAEEQRARFAEIAAVCDLGPKVGTALGFHGTALLAEAIALQACFLGEATFEGLTWRPGLG